MKKGKKKKREGSAVAKSADMGWSTDTSRATAIFKGGRITSDQMDDVFRSSFQVLAPMAADELWRGYGLDADTMGKMPVNKLIEFLVDISPDISKAVWDWQRLFNPGYEFHAYTVGQAEEKIDEEAEAKIAEFLSKLAGPYASPNQVPTDIIINTLSMGGFLFGGLFAELVLDKTGKIPLDIATPNPVSVRFQRIEDDQRGRVWQLGQAQSALASMGLRPGFTPLSRETVVYVPIDPLPGRPFGRPLVHPAIFATLFMIGLLHDLRRVVSQQGYPRLDLVIDAEKMRLLMPESLTGDPDAVQEWFNKTFEEIRTAYGRLQPDDAYVHFDAVTVNVPEGATSAANLGGIDGLIKALERMLTKALKTMPLMMAAENSSVSQANANRQWEIQAAGIKAIQHLLEYLLEKLLRLALQVQGIVARVQFRFAELRASELLRDEQVRMLRIKNARQLYDNGTISADEMAVLSTTESAVIMKSEADSQEPRAPLAKTPAPAVGTLQAEPGANRAALLMAAYAVRKGIPHDPENGLSGPEKAELSTWATRHGFSRNTTAQALLFTSALIPSAEEMDEAEVWFDAEIPEAKGILSAEGVQ